MVEQKDQKSLKNNHRMNIKDIKEKAQNNWKVWVNKTKVITSRFVVRDMVDGYFLGDYTIIHDYCYEILRTNPWSTVKLNVKHVQ